MDPVVAINASLIGQIISFVGIGAFVDSFVLRDEAKRVVSSYILGEKGASFSNFEKKIIDSIIELFHNKTNKISLLRVSIYSTIVLFATLTIMELYLLGNEVNFGGAIEDLCRVIKLNLWTLITVIFVGIIVDYVSLLITKKIFYNGRYNSNLLIFLWLLDLIISCVPGIFIFIVSYYLLMNDFISANTDIVWFVSIEYFTFLMSICIISGLQLSIIIAGFIFRILFGILAPAVGKIFVIFRARENPITLLFVIYVIFFYGAKVAYNLISPMILAHS